jgi:cell division protein FtsN
MNGILRSGTNILFSLLIKTDRYFVAGKFRLLFMLLIFFIITEAKVKSQYNLPGYEDISVLIQVDNYGSFYSDALYSQEGLLYISVEDLFNYLKIPCIVGQKGDSLGGFIEKADRPYAITYPAGEISYCKRITDVKKGLIKQMGMLFLESSFYGQVFGLNLTFNFRSLSVAVKSDFELPIIKAQRIEKMHNNISVNKGETKADTVLGRNYHWFRFGMLDWSVMSNQIWSKTSDTRLTLGLGAELLKGEADIYINYSDKYGFDKRQQQYLWRWVDNDNHFVRQVQTGKIATQTISSVYYPVIGAVLSNTPTSVRRAKGEYIINDVTQPDWLVELYINNVLMDFTKADASGLFMFRVPLVYGFTTLTLRFYGPMGEERSETRTMNVPYSFLPAGEFEYRLSGGMLEDGKGTIFGRGEANFGICRNLTAGAGVEYLASITSGTTIPFLTVSFLPVSKLMIKGEYAHGVRIRGLLNYYLWSNSMLEIDYTKYSKGQHAILYNYLEERKINLSVPLKIKNIAGFARFGYKQNVYCDFNYNIAELLLSVYYKQFNANVSTYANWVNNAPAYFSSTAALSYRMKYGFTIRPTVQINLSKGKFILYKGEIEKKISHSGYISISYENLVMSNFNSLNFSFKYDLPFTQTNASARIGNRESSTSQGARGSLAFGSGNKHIQPGELSTVGRGGISLIPFIDVNHNGVFDKGEQMVENLSVKINGGHVIYSKKDTIIRIIGLEPFISYNLELSDRDFENIAWRLMKRSYKVLIDPNQFKTIEIPIVPVGEVSGMVCLRSDSLTKGIGRILINLNRINRVKIAETLSESDGFLSYLGLEPGEYYASIDSVQLARLSFTVNPLQIPFTIAATKDGDIVDGLDFTLERNPSDTTVIKPVTPIATITKVTPEPLIRMDTSYMTIHVVIQELVTITEDSYAIQLGAFKRRANAVAMRNKLKKLLGEGVEIVTEGDFFKVRITGLKDSAAVDEHLLILRLNGISEVWMIHQKAKKQQWVSTEKQDSIAQIKETIIEKPIPILSRNLTIQAGAFNIESYALALRDRLKGITDKTIEIVAENGYYKVRITGFTSRIEMEKLLPLLGVIGLSDIWILPAKEGLVPVIVQPDTTTKKMEEKTEVPVVSEKPVKPEPLISLQVGVFYKKSDALRAQRRIKSKLKLPVEIIEQWDYYRVIVPGFYTRVETYKYYPELAGLGYPRITLIEKR